MLQARIMVTKDIQVRSTQKHPLLPSAGQGASEGWSAASVSFSSANVQDLVKV